MDVDKETQQKEEKNVEKIVKNIVKEEVGDIIKRKMYGTKLDGIPYIEVLTDKIIANAMSDELDPKLQLEYFNNINEYMGMGKPKYNTPLLPNAQNINIQNNIVTNEDKNKIQELIAQSIIKNRENNNNNLDK